MQMASIQRIVSPLTKEISYRAQVRVKGRPTQSATFANRLKAQKWATSIEAAIDEGRDFPHMRSRRTAFADVTKRYRETVTAHWPEPAKSARERHLKWWEDRFAGLTLAEITADRIVEARDALATEKFTRGKPHKNRKTGEVTPPAEYARSPATCNKYLIVLARVLNLAVKEWRLMDRNPAADISKKKEPRGRVRFLSDAEREALLDACAASDWKGLHTLVMLAISTGARRGELINLKWSNVDLKTARAIVDNTKNGDSRVLPLVGKALDALRKLKLGNSARSEYVFPQASGFPGPYVHFDGYWQEALTAAKLEDFRFHDLRHTTASYLASQGASLLEIADTLGHRTLNMVKRYAHLAQSHKVRAIEKMARERGL
jgi:integrase